MLPQLARPKLRIHEPLNQARIRPLLRHIPTRTLPLTPQRFLKKMLHRGSQAQPLNPLRPPLRRNLLTRRPPHLLRVALEERQVKLPPKPINQKILKTLLRRNLLHPRDHITRPYLERPHQPKVLQRLRRQRNRIIKKPPQIINPALPRSNQHHQIRIRSRLRHHQRLCLQLRVELSLALIRGSLILRGQRPRPPQHRLLLQVPRHRHHPLLPLIRNLRSPTLRHHLRRHQVDPPLHHPVALRKKPVPANIHPVALVLDRPRDPPNLLARLQNHRHHIRPPQQLQPRRQSRRPRTDNHRNALRLTHQPQSPSNPAPTRQNPIDAANTLYHSL